MAARTYLPGLKKVLEAGCKFIQRYRTQILETLGEENAAALDAVITACNVVIALIGVLPIGD